MLSFNSGTCNEQVLFMFKAACVSKRKSDDSGLSRVFRVLFFQAQRPMSYMNWALGLYFVLTFPTKKIIEFKMNYFVVNQYSIELEQSSCFKHVPVANPGHKGSLCKAPTALILLQFCRLCFVGVMLLFIKPKLIIQEYDSEIPEHHYFHLLGKSLNSQLGLYC